MHYRELIRNEMALAGRDGAYDPAVIEGWIRMGHDTLDHLSKAEFRREVALALECADAAAPEVNREVALYC